MDNIIQNIIHIDKNAVEMRKKVDNEIMQRKAEIDKRIENLKYNIIDKKQKELEKRKQDEFKNIDIQEKNIIKSYRDEAEKLENKYKMIKKKFIKDVYENLLFKDR